MGIGHFTGGSPAEARNERRQQADEGEPDERPGHVEDRVGGRGTHGLSWFAERRQDRGDRRSDVRSEDQGDARLERDQTLLGQDDDDPGGCRRGLHECGEEGTDPDAGERVLELRHRIDERFGLAQWFHRVAHERHAEEDQAEAEQGGALRVAGTVLGHEGDAEPHCNRQQRVRRDLEGDDLRGDRCPDVGAEDHPQRLLERHQAGGDESDEEHSRHGRRLDDRSDPCAGRQADESIPGQTQQDVPQPRPRHQSQGFGHAFHAQQKDRQPTEEGDQKHEEIDVRPGGGR